MYSFIIFIVIIIILLCIQVKKNNKKELFQDNVDNYDSKYEDAYKQTTYLDSNYSHNSYENSFIDAPMHISQTNNQKQSNSVTTDVATDIAISSDTDKPIIFVLTMKGDIKTFNEQKYIETLANTMNILLYRIEIISIQPGSVIVTTSIKKGKSIMAIDNNTALQILKTAIKENDPIVDNLLITDMQEISKDKITIDAFGKISVNMQPPCSIIDWSYTSPDNKPIIIMSNNTLKIASKKGYHLETYSPILTETFFNYLSKSLSLEEHFEQNFNFKGNMIIEHLSTSTPFTTTPFTTTPFTTTPFTTTPFTTTPFTTTPFTTTPSTTSYSSTGSSLNQWDSGSGSSSGSGPDITQGSGSSSGSGPDITQGSDSYSSTDQVPGFDSGPMTSGPMTSNTNNLGTSIVFNCINYKWILSSDSSKSFKDIKPIMVKD